MQMAKAGSNLGYLTLAPDAPDTAALMARTERCAAGLPGAPPLALTASFTGELGSLLAAAQLRAWRSNTGASGVVGQRRAAGACARLPLAAGLSAPLVDSLPMPLQAVMLLFGFFPELGQSLLRVRTSGTVPSCTRGMTGLIAFLCCGRRSFARAPSASPRVLNCVWLSHAVAAFLSLLFAWLRAFMLCAGPLMALRRRRTVKWARSSKVAHLAETTTERRVRSTLRGAVLAAWRASHTLRRTPRRHALRFLSGEKMVAQCAQLHAAPEPYSEARRYSAPRPWRGIGAAARPAQPSRHHIQ
jgi:hypothetical protein